MFGVYDYSFQWEDDRGSLGVERRGSLYVYYRTTASRSIEKILGSRGGRIIVNPVEPLNLPQEVTRYLEFHFTPIVVPSESEQRIFLTFPVEIGVFLQDKRGFTVIDIFSFAPQKYSLYGTPDDGVITRHVDSDVFDSVPYLVDPLATGVMELTIFNASRTQVEVTRAVFENASLNVYYGDFVAMKGRMEVYSKAIAETTTLLTPFREGMRAAVPLFASRQIALAEGLKYLMEHGVGG
ncbi:MAG: DUF432 domain-containing protein [Methanospirillum sp.]|nr:DUF432 domain-containing protein [Methanospirillum sp.]